MLPRRREGRSSVPPRGQLPARPTLPADAARRPRLRSRWGRGIGRSRGQRVRCRAGCKPGAAETERRPRFGEGRRLFARRGRWQPRRVAPRRTGTAQSAGRPLRQRRRGLGLGGGRRIGRRVGMARSGGAQSAQQRYSQRRYSQRRGQQQAVHRQEDSHQQQWTTAEPRRARPFDDLPAPAAAAAASSRSVPGQSDVEFTASATRCHVWAPVRAAASHGHPSVGGTLQRAPLFRAGRGGLTPSGRFRHEHQEGLPGPVGAVLGSPERSRRMTARRCGMGWLEATLALAVLLVVAGASAAGGFWASVRGKASRGRVPFLVGVACGLAAGTALAARRRGPRVVATSVLQAVFGSLRANAGAAAGGVVVRAVAVGAALVRLGPAPARGYRPSPGRCRSKLGKNHAGWTGRRRYRTAITTGRRGVPSPRSRRAA